MYENVVMEPTTLHTHIKPKWKGREGKWRRKERGVKAKPARAELSCRQEQGFKLEYLWNYSVQDFPASSTASTSSLSSRDLPLESVLCRAKASVTAPGTAGHQFPVLALSPVHLASRVLTLSPWPRDSPRKMWIWALWDAGGSLMHGSKVRDVAGASPFHPWLATQEWHEDLFPRIRVLRTWDINRHPKFLHKTTA